MNLKRKAITGAKWTSGSKISIALFNFSQTLILARMLSVTDFGLIAYIMIINQFALTFSDMGLSQAIIHYQDSSKKELSSLYWLNIFIGFLIFITLILITPFLSIIFNEDGLKKLISLASINFFILSFGQQFQTILQRDFFFKKISIIETLSSFFGTFLTIFLVYFNLGVFGYVYGQIFKTIIKTGILIPIGLKVWSPLFHFSFKDLRRFINFGSYQMGDRLLNSLNLNLDKIVIGMILGIKTLGYWKFAYDLSLSVYQTVNPIFNYIAFPFFAKIQKNTQLLKNSYFELIRFVSFITMPAYLLLIPASNLLVPILFGEQWFPSIIILQILCGTGLIRSLINPLGSLYLAKGYAKKLFIWNILTILLQMPFILIAALFGNIIAFAIMNLSLYILLFYLTYYYYLHSFFGRCFFSYIRKMALNFVFSAITALVIWIVYLLFLSYNNIYVLLLQGIIGITIYLILNYFLQRDIISNSNIFICRDRRNE